MDPAEEHCPRCYRIMSEGSCPGCGWSALEPVAPEPIAPEPIAPEGDPFVTPAHAVPPLPGADPAELPAFPSGGFGGGEGTPPAGPAPPTVHPRVVVWLLLAAVIGAYFLSGGGFSTPLSQGQFSHAGGLTKDLFEHLGDDGWRLILGTFAHSSLWILIISCFMIWTQGGLAERLGGGGLILFLFGVGGVLLNVLRVGLEPPGSLALLAGSWPAALACGGAAVALCVRARIKTGRLFFSLVFELGLLAWVAWTAPAKGAPDLLTGGLLLVAGCAFGFGLFVGSVWPTQRGPFGCFAGAIALVLVGSAFLSRSGRASDVVPPPREWRERNPVEWEAWRKQNPSVQPGESEELSTRTLEELRVEVDLPRSWGRYPLPRKRDCPDCGAEVELPDPPPAEKDAKVPCPSCGAEVSAHKKQHQVLFQGGGGMFGEQRQILVWAVPRGPYDAPDTLASRFIAELSRPESWFKNAVLVEERDFQSEGMGQGYLASLRGFINGRPMLMRLYLFVDEQRTVLLRSVSSDPGDPFEAESQATFYDSIATTVRRLSKKKPKRD